MFTHPNRRPGPYECTFVVSQQPSGVLDNAVYRKRRQSHTGNALEHRPLRHDHPVVLYQRDVRRRPGDQRISIPLTVRPARGWVRTGCQRSSNIARCHALGDVRSLQVGGILVGFAGGSQDAPVPQIGLVALVDDITEDIGPGNTIRATDQPGVSDWPEGLAYVRCVGDIAVGGEEEGADTVCVGRVSVGGIGAFYVAVILILAGCS